ncbi:hypothetical protein ACJX0J_026037, partial [Zea mays]
MASVGGAVAGGVGAPTPHVLAVDDSSVDRAIIAAILRSSRFRVTAVESGKRALELLGTVLTHIAVILFSFFSYQFLHGDLRLYFSPLFSGRIVYVSYDIGAEREYDNHRLLHARDDGIRAAQEGQGVVQAEADPGGDHVLGERLDQNQK